MLEAKHSLIKSFKFAFDGLKVAILKGRNFRIQLLCGVLASVVAYYLQFTRIEWAVLAISIASILILELINTSLESITNLVSPEIQEEAKIAKDVAAASVLLASIASILIGALVFLPKILNLL